MRTKMCMTCGCGEPEADHGDSSNITFEVLERAAEAAEITVEEAVENMRATLEKMETE